MMTPFCESTGGGFHENCKLYGLRAEITKFVGGLVGPTI